MTEQRQELSIMLNPCNRCRIVEQCTDAHDDDEHPPCYSRPAPASDAPENPCIENGCTDIEDCDEICEHSHIFSPAWVKKHDTAIREQAKREDREKVLGR